MNKIKAAAVQMSMCCNPEENIYKAECMIRKAADEGANIILLPELFETKYFCQERNYGYYKLARTLDENMAVRRFKDVAGSLGVVIPVSFFERDVNNTYNTTAVIDADGSVLGVYRKTHIPDDQFYQEKFYFTPGDTGFKAWKTRFGTIGVGICWDQWFPECARSMALMGADILLYPTAIGSEPILDIDSMPHWRRVMQGHSAANITPVIAANRVGTEKVYPCEENNNQSSSLCFYGSSFMTDETGEIISSADRTSETVIYAEYDLEKIREMRMSWGLFRDRRPDMYSPITATKS